MHIYQNLEYKIEYNTTVAHVCENCKVMIDSVKKTQMHWPMRHDAFLHSKLASYQRHVNKTLKQS